MSSNSNPSFGANNFIRPALVAGLILVIPLIATNRMEGFNWGPGDFVGMGIFIYVFGLIFEFAMVKFPKHRVIVGSLILVIFFLLYGLMATTD